VAGVSLLFDSISISDKLARFYCFFSVYFACESLSVETMSDCRLMLRFSRCCQPVAGRRAETTEWSGDAFWTNAYHIELQAFPYAAAAAAERTGAQP